MIRDQLANTLDHDPHFRWRGEAVTRIENLSDIVFALAMGMIILTSSPPTTFTELQSFLMTVIPVAASFAILVEIWHAHFTFFRRYGVTDGRIIFYNAVLIFVILFVAYPLRFTFDSLFGFIWSQISGSYESLTLMEIDYKRAGTVLAYFAFGYAFIHFILVLMYRYVMGLKDRPELSAAEIVITKGTLARHAATICVALLVAGLAYFTPANGFAGALFFLQWPVAAWAKRKYDPCKVSVET